MSVGSIYNYFDSKAALLSETVGSVWQEIFHRPDDTDALFSQMLSAMLRQDYDPSAVPEIVRRTLSKLPRFIRRWRRFGDSPRRPLQKETPLRRSGVSFWSGQRLEQGTPF